MLTTSFTAKQPYLNQPPSLPLFCCTGFELELIRQTLCCLSHTSRPFCFTYFFKQGLEFMPENSSLPPSLPPSSLPSLSLFYCTGFELRALSLLGKSSATSVIHPTLFAFWIGSQIFAWAGLDRSSYLCFPRSWDDSCTSLCPAFTGWDGVLQSFFLG
jgi:hypothetical protein